MIIGIGALRTRDVLALADDAQRAGARGLLLAPVSYQPLTDEEVFGLFEAVTRTLSVPLIVYDNPRTTRFTFSDALHSRIARLANVASVKIPGVLADPAEAQLRVSALRDRIPDHVTIGVSGDAEEAMRLVRATGAVVGGLRPGWRQPAGGRDGGRADGDGETPLFASAAREFGRRGPRRAGSPARKLDLT